jgi:hypothetical protein
MQEAREYVINKGRQTGAYDHVNGIAHQVRAQAANVMEPLHGQQGQEPTMVERPYWESPNVHGSTGTETFWENESAPARSRASVYVTEASYMGSALQPVVQPASSPVGPAVLSPLGVAERQSMPNHVELICTVCARPYLSATGRTALCPPCRKVASTLPEEATGLSTAAT